jgi:opacity protein-like surface antigen
MKRHLKNIVLTAGLSVLLGSSTLSAQGQKATANIPFAYHVGQQTFSPGTYTIAKSNSPSVFTLRETDTGHEIFMPGVQQDTGDKNAWNLTFSCYAGECSLAQIRMASDSYNLTAKPPVRVGKVAAMISVPLR